MTDTTDTDRASARSGRTLLVLPWLLKAPTKEYTTTLVSNHFGWTKDQARTALYTLEKHGVLRRIKNGSYVLTQQLTTRMPQLPVFENDCDEVVLPLSRPPATAQRDAQKAAEFVKNYAVVTPLDTLLVSEPTQPAVSTAITTEELLEFIFDDGHVPLSKLPLVNQWIQLTQLLLD